MKYLQQAIKYLLIYIVCILGMIQVNAIAAEVTYYHNDISGSPLIATNASGDVLWKENYHPYGEKLTNSVTSQANKIGFHGKPFDDDTGLSYMQARYYDPVVGRFTGVDPVDYQEDNLHSFNRYAYANNNPYKYVDPDGNHPLIVMLGVGYSFISMANGEPPQAKVGKIFSLQPIKLTGNASSSKITQAVSSNQKTYQTYTKTNSKTGEVYVGRTSGTKSPLQNVKARDQNHHMNEKDFGPAVLDKSSSNKAAIRGQEQYMINTHGGAKSTGGTSGNAINGISDKNPNKVHYEQQRIQEFGWRR